MPLTFTQKKPEEVPSPTADGKFDHALIEIKNEIACATAGMVLEIDTGDENAAAKTKTPKTKVMVTATPRIPAGVTQASVASFLAEHLELRDGLFLWQRGFDATEVQRSVAERWGRNAWERVRRQAWRIAAVGA